VEYVFVSAHLTVIKLFSSSSHRETIPFHPIRTNPPWRYLCVVAVNVTGTGGLEGKHIQVGLRVVRAAIIWFMWMQRNVVLFNGATLEDENVMDLIKLKLWQWLSCKIKKKIKNDTLFMIRLCYQWFVWRDYKLQNLGTNWKGFSDIRLGYKLNMQLW